MGGRFSAPFQTSPEAHPAFYTMGTGSFPGVKRPGRGIDHPPPSSAKVKERVGLYLYSPSGPSWPILGRTLPLPLPHTLTLVLLGPFQYYTCYLRLTSQCGLVSSGPLAKIFYVFSLPCSWTLLLCPFIIMVLDGMLVNKIFWTDYWQAFPAFSHIIIFQWVQFWSVTVATKIYKLEFVSYIHLDFALNSGNKKWRQYSHL